MAMGAGNGLLDVVTVTRTAESVERHPRRSGVDHCPYGTVSDARTVVNRGVGRA
jgi:hypothetical protein